MGAVFFAGAAFFTAALTRRVRERCMMIGSFGFWFLERGDERDKKVVIFYFSFSGVFHLFFFFSNPVLSRTPSSLPPFFATEKHIHFVTFN